MKKSAVKNLLFMKRDLNDTSPIIVLVLLVVLLSGCAIKKPLMNMGNGIIDEVALLSTTINFVQQTGVNGPAGVSRGQFRKRADEINSIMSSLVDTLHNAIAINIKTQLGCKVLYGKELHNLPQYQELKKKYELADRLHKEDADFPEVFISSGDFNSLIEQTKCGILFGGMIFNLKPKVLKETLMNLCRDLNVKYIAVPQFILTGFKLDLMSPTNTYFNYSLTIYNQNGDCIATSANTEKTDKLFGKNDLTGSFRDLVKAYLNKSKSIEIKSML
jgi:hypothetical protein